jgi:transcriptional regulator with XRE-family HTH domain
VGQISTSVDTGTLVGVSPRSVFGQNVASLRASLLLTQEQLCERAEIDRSYLQRIESGASNPTIEVVARLKKALKCSWDALLHGME